jgi:hypothetical protein
MWVLKLFSNLSNNCLYQLAVEKVDILVQNVVNDIEHIVEKQNKIERFNTRTVTVIFSLSIILNKKQNTSF